LKTGSHHSSSSEPQKTPSGWFRITNAFVDETLAGIRTLAELKVFLIISRYMNKGLAWPSQEEISQKARMAKGNVSRAIQSLKGKGLIVQVSKGNSITKASSRYRMPDGCFDAAINQSMVAPAQHMVALAHRMVAPAQHDGCPGEALQIPVDKDDHKEQSPRGNAAVTVLLPESLRTDQFETVWAEWVKYRKEINHPLKPTTMSKQLVKLEQFGPTKAIVSLNESMEKGWTGFFEPKGISQPDQSGGAIPPALLQRFYQKRAGERVPLSPADEKIYQEWLKNGH
jgi:hypothetical protein